MQVADQRLLIAGAALGRRREQLFESVLGLPLPAAYLIRVNLVLGRDRLHRAVPAERLHDYLGLELRCEPASFRRHPVGPPHGLGYTLTSCPVFRDHLSHQLFAILDDGAGQLGHHPPWR